MNRLQKTGKKRRRNRVEETVPPWEISQSELREFTGLPAAQADRLRRDREAAWEYHQRQVAEQEGNR